MRGGFRLIQPVLRDDEGGRRTKGRGRGQSQGKIQEGAAAQGDFRGFGELHPDPQVEEPVRTVVLRETCRQALLEGGELPEVVMADQNQSLAGL